MKGNEQWGANLDCFSIFSSFYVSSGEENRRCHAGPFSSSCSLSFDSFPLPLEGKPWRRSQDQICSGKRKNLWNILGIFLFEFRFPVLIPFGCGVDLLTPYIHLLSTNVSANFWTALCEKETWQEKPLRLDFSKITEDRKFEAEIWWIVLYPFHAITGFTLTLFDKISTIFKKSTKESFRLPEQIWSCDRRESVT